MDKRLGTWFHTLAGNDFQEHIYLALTQRTHILQSDIPIYPLPVDRALPMLHAVLTLVHKQLLPHLVGGNWTLLRQDNLVSLSHLVWPSKVLGGTLQCQLRKPL